MGDRAIRPSQRDRPSAAQRANGYAVTDRVSDTWSRAGFREASRVQALAWCFIAMSVCDLLMTYVLLRTSPHYYESNPVALWVFKRWNIFGMTLFKFAIVALVITLGETIERKRPGWGRFVLVAGCGATAFAVARGLRLYLG